MGEEDIGIEDVFCQFAVLENWVGASATLEEVEITTGLALFGDRAWAIHQIEMEIEEGYEKEGSAATGDDTGDMVIAVGKPGLTGTPSIKTPGVIYAWRIGYGFHFTTSGVGLVVRENSYVWKPPTPIPYAKNKISLYTKTSATQANIAGAQINARVCYTFIPTTPQLYKELAERWALE